MDKILQQLKNYLQNNKKNKNLKDHHLNTQKRINRESNHRLVFNNLYAIKKTNPQISK